jgi:hypothetical protein
MSTPRRYGLVLSVYARSRGFAFALFEGPWAPVDWGAVELHCEDKNAACLRRVSRLVARYGPDVIVLKATPTGFRSGRVCLLNTAIEDLAQRQGIWTVRYSRAQVQQHFAGTKHDIALAIAKHIPAFERFVPPVRKPWMSEDARMGIFDAAAWALVFFQEAKAAQTGVDSTMT